MKEVEQSIPKLAEQQNRLVKVIYQREQLYTAVGEGHIKEGTDITTDIKIGRIRARVESSRLRTESHLSAVNENLGRAVEEQREDLILKADKYIDKVVIFKTQLEMLQGFSHHLNPATLEKHSQSLKELESLPETDIELKIGLDLRNQKLEQEKQQEQQRPEQIQKFTVSFPSGQILETNNEEVAKIMELILTAPRKTEELTTFLYGEYNRENMQALHSKLQKVQRLATSINWRVDQPVGPRERRLGQQAVYSLKPIEPATAENKEQLQPVVIPEPQPSPAIPEILRLTTMEKKALEAIWDTFGSSEKAIFTSEWVSRTYQEELTSKRITLEVAKHRHSVLTAGLRRGICGADLEIVPISPEKGEPKGTETKHYIRQIQKRSAKQNPDKPTPPEKDNEEVKRIKETFAIPLSDGQVTKATDDQDIAKLLQSMVSGPATGYHLSMVLRGVFNPDTVNLVDKKIKKARSILPGNWQLEEKVNGTNKTSSSMYSLLNMDEAQIHEKTVPVSEVIKTLEAMEVSVVTERPNHQESVVSTPLPQPMTEVKPISPEIEEKKSTGQRLTQIEKRDPKIRQKILALLEEVKKAHLPELISVGKLTHKFNRLKANWLQQIEEEKRYIQPGRRNGHPLFTQEESILLLYIKDFGNGLSPRLVKEIQEIISQEITGQLLRV